MPTKSRTAMTKRNAAASIINRIVTLLCNFLCRTVFIKHLATEYLGVGGMFGNVFSLISLCELGFGEAVSQSMFKPLAEENMGKIRGLVRYYTVVYRYISLITLTVSLVVMPFLPHFFPDIIKIAGYRTVYLLFIISQMISYRFSPKRSLVMCDQRMYVIMNTRTITSVLVSIFQIIWLLYTSNYLGYLFFRILFQAIDGIAVEIYANKKYGIAGSLKNDRLYRDEKMKIKKNTSALIVHRIGGVINNSTDSILLSSCLGLSHMGKFSNYSLIINSIGSFIALAVSSASASVGNLGAGEDSVKSEKVLNNLTFANFYMLTNCTAVLLCVINPITELWLGKNMCFRTAEVCVIIACFYMSYIRDPVQIFLRNYGVFEKTKFVPLARGILNLVLSYIFVTKLGIAGVFAGTLISTIAVPFFLEPYMLFKYGFGSDCKVFVKTYTGYVVSSFLICAVSYIISSFIVSCGIYGVVFKTITALAVSNLLLILIYGKKAFLQIFALLKRVKKLG